MTDSNSADSTIWISAADRRGLVEQLCAALADTLAGGNAVEGQELIPWHATAESFVDLPADIVRLVLDTLDDEGARLGALELGGFLEIDQGVRAWGTVALCTGEQPIGVGIDVDSISVTESESGWRFEARVNREAESREGADV